MLKSPFVRVDAEGNIVGYHPDDEKSPIEMMQYFQALRDGTISATPSPIESHANGGTIEGDLNNEDGGDMIAVNLTAGQTYTWSYRGTATGGISDPWLRLIGPDQTTVITEDDDGGFGRTSQITFTATADGTYYLHATSWYQIDPTAPSFQDNGDYTIVQWSPVAGHDPGTTIATAGTIEVGTNYGYLEIDDDVDLYAITLTAGHFYTFTYNGGVASETVDPGESIGVLGLQNSGGGTLVGLSVNSGGETGINFFAQQSGTYYLSVQSGGNFGFGPAVQTGGYTIDVAEVDPADRDPLEALNWDSANNITPVMVDGVPTAYVYFAPEGMHFGETNLDGTHMTTYGWTQKEMDAVMLALDQYTPISGIYYEITNNLGEATFRLMTTAIPPGTPGAYGAYFYPQDPVVYGTQQGIGVFNVNSGGWDKPGVSSQDIPGDQVSLDQGGFSFAVILHEFGHAHGIAHPHDTGGGSEVMLGVTGSTGSFGIYNLNQGVHTVMSYNDAWQLHPDGPSSFTIAGIDNGWSGTLSPFDIAVLQARYGIHAHNEGDSTYALTDNVEDAYYQTIWDSGGTDTISYAGNLNAQIDLTAATLDYSPTGGGVVSFIYNDLATAPASAEIKGGYLIANGVVIENATGGNGNDVLVGNDADNVLDGGNGSDTAVYSLADSAVTIDLVAGTATGGGGNDTLISIENAVGSKFNDTLIGDDADNTFDGGDGDDVMSGGNGIDTASYKTVSGGVTVDLRIAAAQNTGGGGTDTLSGFENLTGSNFADNLTGTDGANVINGGGGNDVLSGLLGTDTVSYIDAGAGVTVSLAAGTATGGAGSDTLSSFENVVGSNFGDSIQGDGGDNILDGAFGVDRVSYAAAIAGVTINLGISGAQATVGAGSDTLISFENLTGSNHADTLTGTNGVNDVIAGGGNDTVFGLEGNDTIEGGAGDDALDGGLGTDTASYASAAAAVTVNLAAGTATGGAGSDTLISFENVTGGSAGDTLTGTGDANVINGGGGNDVIDAGGGNDTVNGGTGNDTVNAGDGNDTVNGDAGNDTVNGGIGNDVINGGDGNDVLNGEAGNDTLSGGNNDDTLNGGTGNDRILGDAGVDTVRGGDGIDVVTLGAGDDVFKGEITATKTNLNSGTMSVDIITDFDASGNDWIDLSELGTFNFKGTSSNNKAGDLTYKTYASVNAAESALGFDIDSQPGATVGGQVTVVYGNTDGKAPDFAIVLLNTASVGADDFAPPPPALAAAAAMDASWSSHGGGYFGGHGDYLIV